MCGDKLSSIRGREASGGARRGEERGGERRGFLFYLFHPIFRLNQNFPPPPPPKKRKKKKGKGIYVVIYSLYILKTKQIHTT